MPQPIKSFKVDQLQVHVFGTRAECGEAAANHVAENMRRFIREKGDCAVATAAAPSQDTFLASLGKQPGIDWSKVIAYQIDEYLDIDMDDPRRLVHFMTRYLYDQVKPGDLRFMPTRTNDAEAEAKKYAAALKQRPVDIVFQGIGKSGHIAYNDPGIADFKDPFEVKVVHINEDSRRQQVLDGTVSQYEDAIPRAYTMTVPALLRAPVQSIVCPGKIKANSVKRTLTEPISDQWPATVLRTHANAVLFTDSDGASEL